MKVIQKKRDYKGVDIYLLEFQIDMETFFATSQIRHKKIICSGVWFLKQDDMGMPFLTYIDQTTGRRRELAILVRDYMKEYYLLEIEKILENK